MSRVERPFESVVTLADATTTTMTVVADIWRQNDYAEIISATAGAVGEIAILAATPASTSATVRRAQRGTTGAAASALPARKNPLYPRVAIQRVIEEVIRNDLYPNVWLRTERTLSWTAGDYLYDLDAEDFDILQMYQVIDDRLRPLPYGWWKVNPILSTTEATSGKAIELNRLFDTSETVYYTAKTIPSPDDYSTITDRIAALIPWGACARLLGGTRTGPFRYDPNRQSMPEVQAGGPAQDWRYFANAFALAREEERRTLRYEERHIRQDKFVRTNVGLRRLGV
jgi:hypothetical protein